MRKQVGRTGIAQDVFTQNLTDAMPQRDGAQAAHLLLAPTRPGLTK